MIQSLRLLDFRCFPSLDLEAPQAGVILTGDNAQGKTSILEAICVLVRLHSPRSHRLAPLTRFHSQGFGIAANAWNQSRKVQISHSKLSLTVDHEPRPSSSSYLTDGGRIVWMGNDDLSLVRGPSEARRKYLDFICSQANPHYLRSLSRYRRALQVKNLLLKNPNPSLAEILSYEAILIEHGETIMHCRAQTLSAIAPLAAKAHAHISGRNEPLALTYSPSCHSDLRAAIDLARPKELRLRQAIVGPHRDDLSLLIHGMPAADFASEGQQRTLALSLKLAQGEFLASLSSSPPIYLLDDIFGELDVDRRNALLSLLPADAQKWITTTHTHWLSHHSNLSSMAHAHVANASCSFS